MLLRLRKTPFFLFQECGKHKLSSRSKGVNPFRIDLRKTKNIEFDLKPGLYYLWTGSDRWNPNIIHFRIVGNKIKVNTQDISWTDNVFSGDLKEQKKTGTMFLEEEEDAT